MSTPALDKASLPDPGYHRAAFKTRAFIGVLRAGRRGGGCGVQNGHGQCDHWDHSRMGRTRPLPEFPKDAGIDAVWRRA
jgi:hypothetical protein